MVCSQPFILYSSYRQPAATSLVLESLALMENIPVREGWRLLHDEPRFQVQAAMKKGLNFTAQLF